jgi:hypothetical protein
VLDRRRAALELEFEAELAAGVYSLSNGERREGPQLTFPPPPPAAPPRDVWEADAWVPVLSRRGAPHASRLAEAELEAQLTRLVLSLMVASPGGDDAPARRGGQGFCRPLRGGAAAAGCGQDTRRSRHSHRTLGAVLPYECVLFTTP